MRYEWKMPKYVVAYTLLQIKVLVVDKNFEVLKSNYINFFTIVKNAFFC